MNTQMNLQRIAIEKLKPAKYNPRKDLKPGDPAYEKIKRSLREFGYVDPVIWNEVTGNIVGGHQRHKVLVAEGATEIDCVVVHIENPQDEKALNIALNKAVGEWEPVALADLLSELQTAGYDLGATGFDAAEIDDLFSKVHDKDVQDDECTIDPDAVTPFVHPGDVWTLGRHRMVCGDATKAADVALLMDGIKANLVVTDPPYNVSYESADGKTIQNDNMADGKFYEFLFSAFQNMAVHMAEGGSAYIFHADTEGLNFRRAFKEAGFHISGVCIWAKNSLVLGRSPYQWQHEPVLFGWLPNGKHRWFADRKQTTIWNFDKPKHSAQHSDDKRTQIVYFCIDDLVPEDHLLRMVDRALDWTFIYDLVKERYSADEGRPSMDPVTLIKMPFIQYLYGIRSMRQTIKEINVNVAYRWFLGLGLHEAPPHFTTFGKNYTRRFKDTDLFELIFEHILEECYKHGFVDSSEVFVDSTHVKARANTHKKRRELARKESLFYEEQLKAEINQDRVSHGKKPLKEKIDAGDDSAGGEATEIKVSTTDPESGWFHKGEHQQVFAYGVSTAADKHGWILGYDVNPGNEHDSRTFVGLYEKLKGIGVEKIIADAGYKTPAIAKLLLDAGITPVFPYTRPMTKDGFFKKYEYVYDEFYDCYICPSNKVLKYSTTNRNGYREYKSNPEECRICPYLQQCTQSANRTKVVTRHVWANYLEICDDIRHTLGMKDLYKKRKETIERIFGTAKEYHGQRYTHMYGKARMNMKVSLTYACMNLKKLAKMLKMKGKPDGNGPLGGCFYAHFLISLMEAAFSALESLNRRKWLNNEAVLA